MTGFSDKAIDEAKRKMVKESVNCEDKKCANGEMLCEKHFDLFITSLPGVTKVTIDGKEYYRGIRLKMAERRK